MDQKNTLYTADAFAGTAGREITSLRGKFEKHYDLGMGRRQAIIYAAPVHYLENGSGEWKDIDNTLEEAVDRNGRHVYRNRSGRVKFEFPATADGGSTASITDGSFTFSWGLDGKTEAVASRVRTGAAILRSRRARESLQDRRVGIPRLRAENTYSGICPGITLRYSLNGETMKEDIIADSAEALRGVFLRLPDEYSYSVTDEMQLRVSDKSTGRLRFFMGTPVVYDANGIEDAARISIADMGGYTRLSYVIDEGFLSGAAYPVTIDPVVMTATTDSAVCDAYIWAKNPTTNYGSVYLMRCGDGSGGESISLIKFNRLVKLRASDTVISARLRVSACTYPSDPEIMGCYPIKTSWTETGVTWNKMTPANDTHISSDLLAYIPATTPTYCYFDITSLYRGWYQKNADGTSRNYGVAIRRPPEVNSGGNYVEWYTTQYDCSRGPCMVVNYVSHAGRKSWWQYESMSAGRAGTAYTDIYNGNLVFEHNDGSTSGPLMPVSLKHVYNSCLSESNPVYCGNGWRTNMHQSVCRKSLSGVSYYVWTDGDATEHYFAVSGSQPYTDMEGMSLKLTVSGSTLTITDKDHIELTFPLPSGTAQKYLTQIRNAVGSSAALAYSGGKLATITDGSGHVIRFTYNSSGNLSDISVPGSPSLSFSYTGSNLTGIAYSDVAAGQTSFAYESGSSMLVSACNYDGLTVNVQFENESSYDSACIDSYAKQIRRVVALEQASGSLSGARQLFEYLPYTTKVTAVENTGSDAGKVLTYRFNDAGNVVCCYDSLGFAVSSLYSGSTANQQTAASKLQKAVVNMLSDIDFSSGWSASGSTAERDTSVRCLNMPSVRITKASEDEAAYSQTVSVDAAGKYTFSAYVRNTALLASGRLFLRAAYGENTYESRGITGATSVFNTGSAADGWERLYVTIPATAAGNITLELVSTASCGSAWFACPQLEAGSSANHVNLLLNGDFSRTAVNGTRTYASGWTASSGTDSSDLNGIVPGSSSDMPEGLGGNALRIHCDCTTADSFHYQTISASGSAGDIFVAGGWVNASSVSCGDGHFKASVITSFMDMSGSWSDWQYNEYDAQRTGWKFGEWAVSAPSDYQAIKFGLRYALNTGTAMFSNMFLYREEFGRSFEYDENKNLVGVSYLSGQKADMEYDDADNLISYRQPGAASDASYTMNYGTGLSSRQKHLLLESTTPEGIKDTYTYDANGNVLTSIRQDETDHQFIKTENSYSESGGYIVRTATDARGCSIERKVNAETGTLASMTDPDDHTVSYLYDSSKRVTSVESSADGQACRNDYTYENDRIKTVSHNTTGDASDVTYTFEYDALGRKTAVSVGNNILSQNTYSTSRSGLLSEVHYGNGGMIGYEYDGYDRLTGIKYDDDTSARYTYGYDASGNVSEACDNNLGRTLHTEYDLTGRPMGTQLRDSDGDLLYRTELDYDAQNRLAGFAEETGGVTYKTSYSYDNDNRITEIGFGGDNSIRYEYDRLGRISCRTADESADSDGFVSAYTYKQGGFGNNSTSLLVSEILQPHISFEYRYDDRGNIVSEKRGELETTYAYDALGQLIRVNDPHENATWVYTYDRGGNILSKTRYACTTGTPGTAVETIPYVYGDSNWKDKLTAYNGQAITYDAIGNPVSDAYYNYTWGAGRQLMSIASNNTGFAVRFEYDSNGMRVRKTCEPGDWYQVITGYTYHGRLLAHMTVDYHDDNETARQDVLHFFYDAQDRPAKIMFNGSMYTCLHNLQGDIVGLLDSTGALVVEYKYDAWGRLLSTSGSLAETLGVRNPFRYRGYVYDEETGLYYLKNRYYSPEICKWINCDRVIYINADLSISYTYAYCNNNPIASLDPDGYSPWNLIIPDWGYIHREVQSFLAETYTMLKEVAVTGMTGSDKNGRLDLTDLNGQCYEIKPNNLRAIKRGINQINRYFTGKTKYSVSLHAGICNEDQSFISHDSRFQISVEFLDNGIVVYDFDTVQKNNYDINTEPSTVEDAGFEIKPIMGGGQSRGAGAGRGR